MKAGTHKSKTQ